MPTTVIRPPSGDDPGCIHHEENGFAWLEGHPCPPHEELPGRPEGIAGRGWECCNCSERGKCECDASYRFEAEPASAQGELFARGAE